MELDINKKDVSEPDSKTPLKTGPLCSGRDFIDILRDGVTVDDDEDLESEDLIIQFDFEAIIQTVKNQLKDEKNDPLMSFEHITLLHKKSKEILIEPLVETYLNLKWQSLKGWWYGYRFMFFLTFGVCLTLMMSFIVEMNNHCRINTSEPELNNKTIEIKPCLTVSGPEPNKTCETECTDKNHDQFWCWTNTTTTTTNDVWGNCGPDCKINDHPTIKPSDEHCDNNLSTLSIANLVKTNLLRQKPEVAFFIDGGVFLYCFRLNRLSFMCRFMLS